MNIDSQLIWENYKNKLLVDHFDVMIERADRYVNGLLERISPEDIQRMKDADVSGDKKTRRRLRQQLQMKYHTDKGGDHEDSIAVNNWLDLGEIPYSDTQSNSQSQSRSEPNFNDFWQQQQSSDGMSGDEFVNSQRQQRQQQERDRQQQEWERQEQQRQQQEWERQEQQRQQQEWERQGQDRQEQDWRRQERERQRQEWEKRGGHPDVKTKFSRDFSDGYKKDQGEGHDRFYAPADGTYGKTANPYEYVPDEDENIHPDVVDKYNYLMDLWNRFRAGDFVQTLGHNSNPLAGYLVDKESKQYAKSAADWWNNNKHEIPQGEAGTRLVVKNIMMPKSWAEKWVKNKATIKEPGSFKASKTRTKTTEQPPPQEEPAEEPNTTNNTQQDSKIIDMMNIINNLIDDDVIKGAENYKRGDFDPDTIKSDIERLEMLSSKLSEMLQFLMTGDSQSTSEQTTNVKDKISKINKLRQKIGKMFNKTGVTT